VIDVNGLTSDPAAATAKVGTTGKKARKTQRANSDITIKMTGEGTGIISRPGTPSKGPAKARSRLIRDGDGSLRLRGAEKPKAKLENARTVMTCAPKATKTYTPALVRSVSPHDRAHQVTDSQSKLIPAARTRRGHTKVLVEEAKPREYPEYYMANVHTEETENGPVRVGNSFEDQCDALHERRLRLEGVPGLGYGNGESAAEQAQQYLARTSPQEFKAKFRSKPW
jgi:hypothetical protein